MKSKKPSLYDAQEEQIQLQSASFVDFLTRKGVLEDHNIDNERVRKAKKDTAQRAYHNTEVLLSQYRLIIWVLECIPGELSDELEVPVHDIDALAEKIDIQYPLCSLQLFGSKEVWRKLIHKHSQRQEYRIPGHADKIICRLLLITGKGKSKSVRLSKGGQNILEIVNPNAALYYTQNYLRHNHAGEAKRLDRFHRVAESAALINLAGFETCPYRLPQLQMVTIRKVVTDAPSFYISKELKYVGDDDVNKTSFSRITGALFCPGGCYAVYNSRDYLMNWNGRGEAKVRLHLTEIARMNADVDDVQSAILLGTGYEIAEITLRTLWKTKRAETEFTVIYDHLHFIPLNGFGVRLLKILTTPDWNETLLDLLFDPNDRSYGKGVFEYDARENGIYLFSFLDSDITRLNHFIDGTKGIERETAVICFPEQTAFVRNVVGPKVSIKTVIMDMVEDALCPKGGDADE